MPTTYSWRSAAVVGCLLALGLLGWSVVPDFYAREVRAYLPSLLLVPGSVGFGMSCFHSPACGDRPFGWIGRVLGLGLTLLFAWRPLALLGWSV
jgi:hypothetical protein